MNGSQSYIAACFAAGFMLAAAAAQGQTYPSPGSAPNSFGNGNRAYEYAPGSDEYSRYPMQPAQNTANRQAVQQVQYTQPQGPQYQPPVNYQPPPNYPPVNYQPQPNYQPAVVPPAGTIPNAVPPGAVGGPSGPFVPISGPGNAPSGNAIGSELGLPPEFLDIDAVVAEAPTGRFMIGVGVNSDAGVTGQVVLDERNFDITRVPSGFGDFANGTAFRGAGQGFRLEAMPGSQVQRYMVSFNEPYLFDTAVSMNVSAFYYSRNFYDWDEERLGGRLSFGHRLTHDLSLAAAIRAEHVVITDPRVPGVQELDEVVGDSDLFSGRITLTHDTRDIPFAATEGHLIELAFEQAFGSFDYPRAEIDLRKYFLMRERPDGSGRHTLSYLFRAGFSGSQTPIYENFFAGGFSTMRGFDFRGASPIEQGVRVGGEFRFLGSVEYMFPITADDMIKGVVFCDYGTVERKIEINADNYRVAPGFGIRVNVPALGPAPLAFDFAVPIAHADGDDLRNFSFFFGFGGR